VVYSIINLDDDYRTGRSEVFMANTSRQYRLKLSAGESLSLPLAVNLSKAHRATVVTGFASSCKAKKTKDGPSLPCGPYLTYNSKTISFEVDGSMTRSSDAWMEYDFSHSLAVYSPL